MFIQWHWATYAAFCRQYGTYNTGAAGYHCWNEEAMSAMNDDLTDPLDRFQRSVHRELHNASAFVSQTLDWAISRYLGQCYESCHS